VAAEPTAAERRREKNSFMIRGRERGRLMRKPRKEGKVEERIDD
jgi:hypothetical protein